MNFTSENPQTFYTLHWSNIWQKRLKIDKLSSVKYFRTHRHPVPWFLPALLDHRMRSISVLQQNLCWGSWSYWCPPRFGTVIVHNLKGNPSLSPALKQGFPMTRAEQPPARGPNRISDNNPLPNLCSFTSLLRQTAHLGSCSCLPKPNILKSSFNTDKDKLQRAAAQALVEKQKAPR